MSKILYPVSIVKDGLPKRGGYYLFAGRNVKKYMFFSPLSNVSLSKVKSMIYWYRERPVCEITKTSVQTTHQRALNHWKESKNFHLSNKVVRMGVLDNLFRDAIINAYKSGAKE